MIEPLVYGDCTSPTKIIDTINLCIRALNTMEAANTSTNSQSAAALIDFYEHKFQEQSAYFWRGFIAHISPRLNAEAALRT